MQWVSESVGRWVILSDFRDSYSIYRACSRTPSSHKLPWLATPLPVEEEIFILAALAAPYLHLLTDWLTDCSDDSDHSDLVWFPDFPSGSRSLTNSDPDQKESWKLWCQVSFVMFSKNADCAIGCWTTRVSVHCTLCNRLDDKSVQVALQACMSFVFVCWQP